MVRKTLLFSTFAEKATVFIFLRRIPILRCVILSINKQINKLKISMISDEEEKHEIPDHLSVPSKEEYVINIIRNNGFFSGSPFFFKLSVNRKFIKSGYLRTFAISPDSTRAIVRTTPYSIEIIDLEAKKPVERLSDLQTSMQFKKHFILLYE